MINPESNFTRFDASWKTRKYAVAFIFCVTILFQIVAVKCEKLSQDSLAARHGLKSVCDTDVNIFAEKLIELALASTHQPEKLRRDKLEAKVQQLVNQERSRPKHEQVVAAKFYLFACNPTTYEVSKRMNTFKEMTKPKGFNCFGLAWRLSGTDRREHATVMMVAGMRQTESGRHAPEPAPARRFRPQTDTIHVPLTRPARETSPTMDNLDVPGAAAPPSSAHSSARPGSAGPSSRGSSHRAAPTSPRREHASPAVSAADAKLTLKEKVAAWAKKCGKYSKTKIENGKRYNITSAGNIRKMLNTLNEIMPGIKENQYKVGTSLSEEDKKSVRKQYRKACMVFHPDRKTEPIELTSEIYPILTEAYDNYYKRFLCK